MNLQLDGTKILYHLDRVNDWNKGKDDVKKRFIDKNNKISDDKLVFLKIISIVVKSQIFLLQESRIAFT